MDRKVRQRSQLPVQAVLKEEAKGYKFGKVLNLPSGNIFPLQGSTDTYFDLQIEGVGTKTLLAELSGRYDTIGIDGVAMAVNDILRSGADPVLVSDAIHIRKSDPKILTEILSGIRTGASLSGCTLASGETGDVSEILHSPFSERGLPFDLFVSCLGLVKCASIIRGKISSGDRIIGLESSGIHSNALTLARKILLKRWGGAYDPHDEPDDLGRPLIDELLEPTRIYAKSIRGLRNSDFEIKAALHVTGDGVAKFWRLLRWQRREPGLGARLKLSTMPPIFQLISDTAKEKGTPVSTVEMFRTFNMGVGFVVVVSAKDASRAVDSLNNECHAEVIGSVTGDGKISVESPFNEKPLLL